MQGIPAEDRQRGNQEEPQAALAHVWVDIVNGVRRFHLLHEHSQAVGEQAATFAAAFGPQWGRIAGRWHDLGKFRQGFRDYIRGVNGLDAHLELRWPTGSEKSHSAAGALHALGLFGRRWPELRRPMARSLAYVIAGHHAGLADWVNGLDDRLLGSRSPDSRREHDEAVAACRQEAPELLELPPDFDLESACRAIPGVGSTSHPLALSMWIRMLFSALVDADFLDTEHFMDVGKSLRRQGFAAIADYQRQLDQHLAHMAAEVEARGRSQDPVMRARRQVLEQCRAKAALPPGVFTLTVPTGGGKTLSSLAFALTHAAHHGHRRVIYAIPYTSILEQTADSFSRIFGADAVIEHHSQVEFDPSDETPRSRLACENWDAPLVVTTNVQLFESLFAARTSRCRKLHRIARSVIVLDEAQLLPPEFLQPILDALHLLVSHYGVTVLLCTATQPVLTDQPRFDPRQSLRGLPAPTPIVEDEAALYRQLQRVQVEWPDDLHTPCPTDVLVGRLATEDCVLVIVNTRADAAEIVAALDAATGDQTLHLSAAMCGQHRADVIAEIRRRLEARRSGADVPPLRVVSTQLVEAGVDVDFPVVFRALAGLDSIAQAAGRCNREGLLPGDAKGRVVVFVRALPRTLAGLRNGAQATIGVRAVGLDDALSPEAFERYFPQYYDNFPSRDRHGIVGDLSRDQRDLSFPFRSVAKRFKFVDDADQATLIVPYASPVPGGRDPRPLITKLQAGETDRWLLRALQRYTVTVRRKPLAELHKRGDVRQVGMTGDCFILTSELLYDARRGLLNAASSVDPALLVF